MTTRLLEIAKRVSWYDDPARLLSNPDRFLAFVMARGRTEDIVEIQRSYPLEALQHAYRNAPPGLFSERAWAYWGLVLLGVPDRPLPRRFVDVETLDWRRLGTPNARLKT